MGLLDRFKNKKTIHAHVLDPNTGYTVQEWVVGADVDTKTVRQNSEDGKIFVLAAYENGKSRFSVVSRRIWDKARGEFERIDNKKLDFDSQNRPHFHTGAPDKDARLNYGEIIDSGESQTKQEKLAKKLVNQAIGTQSVWYSSIFKKGFELDDRKISKLEITFFTLTTIQMAYLSAGKGSDEDKKDLLDEVAFEVLKRSTQATDVGMDVAVPAFQNRYREYCKLLVTVLKEKGENDASKNTLWTIYFNVTGGNPRDQMIKLLAYSPIVYRTITDQFSFVQEQLVDT